MISRRYPVLPLRRYSAPAEEATVEEEEYQFVCEAEAVQAKLLDSAERQVDEYNIALNDVSSFFLLMFDSDTDCQLREDMTVEDQKNRSKTIKDLAGLASAWESYNSLRKVHASFFTSSTTADHLGHLGNPDSSERPRSYDARNV